MRIAVCVLALFFLGVAECRNRWGGLKDGPYEVGPLLDEFLIEVNRKLASDGLTSYNLNDFLIAGATGKGVVIKQLDTLKRRGSATVANDGDVFLANVTLGLDTCIVSVEALTYGGKTAPVQFVIEDNSVHIAYSVDISNKINCSLTWNIFQLETFNKVTTVSSEPSFNRADVSTLFSTVVMQQLNKHFASSDFLGFLDENVNPCRYKGMSEDPIAELHRLVYIH